MKENLDLSIKLATKLKKVFKYGVDKQIELVKRDSISDELADILLFNIETFQSLIIVLDDLLDALNERYEIFGAIGLEKETEIKEEL